MKSKNGFSRCGELYIGRLQKEGRFSTAHVYKNALFSFSNFCGQEFNLVIEGTVVVTWADKEFELNAGDSIYFNPEHPHGQRCGGDVPAKFVTIIAE